MVTDLGHGNAREHFLDRRRHLAETLAEPESTITVITTKQFVTAVPGKGNFHVCARDERKMMCRKRRRVTERLAVNFGQFLEVGCRVRLHDEILMPGPEM